MKPDDTNDRELATLDAALERLRQFAEKVVAMPGKGPGQMSDPAANIELDLDKVNAKAGGGPEKPAGGDWSRIGDILGAATTKALGPLLERLAGLTSKPDQPAGQSVSGVTAGGAGAPHKSRFGRVGRFVAGSRVGRAVHTARQKIGGSKAGRAAKRVGGAVAGSMVGRAVGSLGGPAGTIIGGLAGGAVGGAMGSRAAGGAGAGAGRGGLAGGATGAIVGGLLGGPIGAVGGGIAGAAIGGAAGGAAKAVEGFGERVKETSRELVAYNRSLGQFSALIAAQNARIDLKEMSRERQRGDRLAASAEYLNQGEQTRKDNTLETEIFFAKIDNYVTGFKNELLAGLYAPLNELLGLANKMMGRDRGKMALGASLADAEGAKRDQEKAGRERQRQEEIGWLNRNIPGRDWLGQQLGLHKGQEK